MSCSTTVVTSQPFYPEEPNNQTDSANVGGVNDYHSLLDQVPQQQPVAQNTVSPNTSQYIEPLWTVPPQSVVSNPVQSQPMISYLTPVNYQPVDNTPVLPATQMQPDIYHYVETLGQPEQTPPYQQYQPQPNEIYTPEPEQYQFYDPYPTQQIIYPEPYQYIPEQNTFPVQYQPVAESYYYPQTNNTFYDYNNSPIESL